MKEKLVYSCTDGTKAEYVCSILKENDIPFVKRTAGAGEYLTIVAGTSFNSEINIFVDEKKYKKASELLETVDEDFSYPSEEDIPDELKDITSEEEEELEKDIKKNNKYLIYFIIFFVFLPILVVVISAIITDK